MPQRFRPSAALGLALLTSACAGGALDGRPRIDPALERALASLADPRSPVRLDAPPGARCEMNGALLNGLDGAGVEAVFGDPGRKRIDPPAEVWLYDRPRCFVDVFLFDEGRGARVVYVQERLRQVKKIPPGACLGEVWQARHERPLR